MNVKVIPRELREQLVSSLKEEIRKKCGGKKSFDQVKSNLALVLSRHLSRLEWVRKIYYTEISSGQFVESSDYSGRDIDLAIIASREKIPLNGGASLGELAERLERELEEIVEKAIEESGLMCDKIRKILKEHGFIEIHINDMYARLIEKKDLGSRLSDTNAIRLYPRGR